MAFRKKTVACSYGVARIANLEQSRPVTADPIVAAMDQAAAEVPRLLAPSAVAEMLGLTERTLERWRITGEGPRFVKLSRSTVRYMVDDVAAFVAGRLRANTSQ